MNTPTKQIPIFKVGRHTDMNGTTLEITEADLEKTVTAYQPSRHEAPLVAGHPQHDAPAWGWVADLALRDGILWATPSQVDPNFAEQVMAGRYKKISASFYTPSAPNSPYPGVYYLRHVGFLGAQPPAVKGLPDAAFREEVQGVVVLETTTSEVKQADANLEQSGQRSPKPAHHIRNTAQTMSYKEKSMPDIPENQETPVTPVAVTRLARDDLDRSAELALELRTKETALQAREVQFAERERLLHAAENELRRQQNMANALQFIEEMIQQGRILPRHREGLVAFIGSLDEANIVEFAESGEQDKAEQVVVKTPATTYFRQFLKELPIRVDFAERSADSGENEETYAFAVPDGYQVDAVGLEMHRKILSYARKNNMDFASAAMAVYV